MQINFSSEGHGPRLVCRRKRGSKLWCAGSCILTISSNYKATAIRKNKSPTKCAHTKTPTCKQTNHIRKSNIQSDKKNSWKTTCFHSFVALRLCILTTEERQLLDYKQMHALGAFFTNNFLLSLK